jgi:hypothetical protein
MLLKRGVRHKPSWESLPSLLASLSPAEDIEETDLDTNPAILAYKPGVGEVSTGVTDPEVV